jgi:hypothetical protein
MISTSAGVAPFVHAAYVFSIVATLWPSSSATGMTLCPAMSRQLTHEWRALYGSRERTFLDSST